VVAGSTGAGLRRSAVATAEASSSIIIIIVVEFVEMTDAVRGD
jgi:hypothetical protein